MREWENLSCPTTTYGSFFLLFGDQIDLNHPFTHTNHLKTSSEKMACQLGKRRRKRKKSSRVSIVTIVCVCVCVE